MKRKVFKLSTLAVFLLGLTCTVQADEWSLVTEASTLAVGDQLIIASNAKSQVMGSSITTASKSSYFNVVEAEFSSDNASLTSFGEDAAIFTLGGEEGNWTLTNASGKLLGCTAAKKLAWGSGTTTWEITIDSNGDATIYNTSSSYGRILYNYNNGSSRFTTYISNTSTTMLLPQLYRSSKSSASSGYTFIYDGYTGNTTHCAGGKQCAAGDTIIISSGTPTKVGDNFLGWTYNGKIYQPGDQFIMPSSDVTLVAKWQYSTAVEETIEDISVHKIIRDGGLYIIVDGVTYDSLGRKVE